MITKLQSYNVHLFTQYLQTASTRIIPTPAAKITLTYHTYSLTLYGHRGNRQIAMVATTRIKNTIIKRGQKEKMIKQILEH